MKHILIPLGLGLPFLLGGCTPPESRSVEELEALKLSARRNASTPNRIQWENRYHACFVDSAPMPNYGDKALENLVIECEASKAENRPMKPAPLKPVAKYVYFCHQQWLPKCSDRSCLPQLASVCAEKGYAYDYSFEVEVK